MGARPVRLSLICYPSPSVGLTGPYSASKSANVPGLVPRRLRAASNDVSGTRVSDPSGALLGDEVLAHAVVAEFDVSVQGHVENDAITPNVRRQSVDPSGVGSMGEFNGQQAHFVAQTGRILRNRRESSWRAVQRIPSCRGETSTPPLRLGGSRSIQLSYRGRS